MFHFVFSCMCGRLHFSVTLSGPHLIGHQGLSMYNKATTLSRLDLHLTCLCSLLSRAVSGGKIGGRLNGGLGLHTPAGHHFLRDTGSEQH